MTALGYCVLAVVILAAGIVVLWDRHKTKKTLRALDAMVESAIKGDFTEKTFDESLQSALETKLANYLSVTTRAAGDLRTQREQLESLLSDISHQTRTPLANLLLYTQLLSEQELTEEGRACVAALETQGEKLQALIEALVKTSRLENGTLALHPARNPLTPMLEDAVAQVRPKAEERSIAVTLQETNEEAFFDPKWTGEALYNLLDNAVKYTPEGGSVEITVMAYELFCRIDVSDTGIGVPAGEQNKVFSRFYRASNAGSGEGVGVGLYLARQIVTRQGGYMKLTGREGEGSIFSIFLPRN